MSLFSKNKINDSQYISLVYIMSCELSWTLLCESISQ